MTLLSLGVKVTASTVWEILRAAGVDPAPGRAATTWSQLLRSRAEALLTADFIETITLTGTRVAVINVLPRDEIGRAPGACSEQINTPS